MKNIIITGAGRGIGLALTKEFVQKGFQVIATYREEKGAKDLLQFAKEAKVITVTADMRDEETFGPLKKQVEKLGSIDILINNAGVIGETGATLAKLNPKKMMETFDVNTFGPLRMSQLALPFMKKGGTVAHITSLMGSIDDNASGGYYDYRMSKTALNMFNSCLAKEFTNITCLVLHPGWVQTDMGGKEAPTSKEESARGLCKVILNSSLEETGKFFDYTGKNLPW